MFYLYLWLEVIIVTNLTESFLRMMKKDIVILAILIKVDLSNLLIRNKRQNLMKASVLRSVWDVYYSLTMIKSYGGGNDDR